MKKVFSFLLFIGVVTGIGFYMYRTNPVVNDIVTVWMDKYHKSDVDDSLALMSDTISYSQKSTTTKKKIPKLPKPDKFYHLDQYAIKTPKKYESDIISLANYLIQPTKSDIEKARVLFTWVATHVKYDDKAYNTDFYTDYSAENVLKTKLAVCAGYANLLKALCDAAGLESEKIVGYAKGYSYRVGMKFNETNHAWNAIKIDNQWKLFDATWASSSSKEVNGKLVSTSTFDPFWFDVAPKAFIFSHFPKSNQWQLTDDIITKTQFEKLPFIGMSIFQLGFNSDSIYKDVLSGKVKYFVETYYNGYPIDVSKMPYTLNLVKGKEQTMEIISDYAEEIALIDGSDWIYFKKDSNNFHLNYTPKNKEVSISVKMNWFDKNFKTILNYKVIK